MYKFLFFIVLLLNGFAYSQTLIQKIELHQNAQLMSVDEMGNIYVVSENNAFTQFSANGDSLSQYNSVQNGKLSQIDTRNPLKILLFYPDFSKIVILDRLLTVKTEIDLKKLQIFQASAIGMGMDGNVWVYDGFNAQLLKINEQAQIVNKSEDLRSAIQTFPNIISIVENERKVYLLAAKTGIFVFDQFANYINQIEISNAEQLQVFDHLLVYKLKDKLINYNTLNGIYKTIDLPKDADFISSLIAQNNLYFLYKNKIEIFKLQ